MLDIAVKIPLRFALALIETDSCPACLARLYEEDVCACCGFDVSPILDAESE